MLPWQETEIKVCILFQLTFVLFQVTFFFMDFSLVSILVIIITLVISDCICVVDH